jgi:hypothetical protein
LGSYSELRETIRTMLRDAALAEPRESGARVYLLSAAYIHTRDRATLLKMLLAGHHPDDQVGAAYAILRIGRRDLASCCRTGRIVDQGLARVYACSDAQLARLVVSDTKLRKLCRLAEDRLLVVPAGNDQSFREALCQLGYAAPPASAE